MTTLDETTFEEDPVIGDDDNDAFEISLTATVRTLFQKAETISIESIANSCPVTPKAKEKCAVFNFEAEPEEQLFSKKGRSCTNPDWIQKRKHKKLPQRFHA